MVDQTLKQHEELIDEHDDRLDKIQQDLIDVKTRLGIKDVTNGHVLEYYEQLMTAQELEKSERKEQDALLREDIKAIDDKTWFIVTGIILSIILEIALFVVGG